MLGGADDISGLGGLITFCGQDGMKDFSGLEGLDKFSISNITECFSETDGLAVLDSLSDILDDLEDLAATPSLGTLKI